MVLGSRCSSVVVWGPRLPLVVLGAHRHSWGVLLGARRFSWVEVLGTQWWWWTLIVFCAPWCVALVAVLVVISSFEDEGVGSSFVFAGAHHHSMVGALCCGRSLLFVPFSRWWMVVVSFVTLVLGQWGSPVICPCSWVVFHLWPWLSSVVWSLLFVVVREGWWAVVVVFGRSSVADVDGACGLCIVW